MPEAAPFTGIYPSLDEIHEALVSQDVPKQSHTAIVSIPEALGGGHGQLDESLTKCKSKNLSQGWPVMFRVVVNKMLETTQDGTT